MKILFFDTETTGLPDFKQPSSAHHQPHVIQAAALLTDSRGNELREWNTLIKTSEDATMHPLAYRAHGISLQKANDEGIEMEEAWRQFTDLVSEASIVVGHNVPFDLRMMRIMGYRVNGFEWDCPADYMCTMRMACPIVNLPPTKRMQECGMIWPKNPNLTECMRFFFDEPLDGAHDALADVRACKRVYFAITNTAEYAGI